MQKLGLQDSIGEALIKQALLTEQRARTLSAEKMVGWRKSAGLNKGEVRMLRRISKDWRLIQAASHLPGDIKTVMALTQLDSYMINESLKKKLISPKMTLEQAQALST